MMPTTSGKNENRAGTETRFVDWLCFSCGKEHGSRWPEHPITVHNGTCEYCGKYTSVTAARHFGYPKLLARYENST